MIKIDSKTNKSDKNLENQMKKVDLTYQQMMQYAKAMVNTPIDAIVKEASTKMIKRYSKETVRMYLEYPQKNEDKLRTLVDYLCTISPQFCRVIEYIPNMAIIAPLIIQNDNQYKGNKADKKKKEFLDMCDFTDTLDIKNISQNILKEVFKYGVYYGINVEGMYKNYTKKLNPNYCKIIGEGESGLEIAFDFGYFNGNEYILDNGYPPIFRKLFNDYKNGITPLEGLRLSSQWQPIPQDITVCIKYDLTNLSYSVPPYANIFSAIYDLEEYQSLNKAKVTAENYTLIGLKIPTINNSEQADNFTISSDFVDATTSQLENSLPDYMGYFTTPMDVTQIKASSPNDSKVDTVANAVRNLWNSSGFAESIFGVNNNNSGTLDYSIRVDEQQLFGLYRQLGRYFDYKLKPKYKNKFKLKLLEVTWFNLKSMVEYYKTESSLSVPVTIILPLLLGYEMGEVYNLNIMQNDIYNILEEWNCPKTSYTQDSGTVGAPIKPQDELTNSGDKTRENDSNNK